MSKLALKSGVLSALATFRILQEPLRNFPDLVSMIAQTKVSLDRISGFLQEEELPSDETISIPKSLSEFAIEINDGDFSWEPSMEKLTLSGINLQVKRGMRVAVCGVVGSGKSSFLSSILGEIPKVSGQVKISGTTAYVSQSAWIQTGNIEDNILFGSQMDKARYKNTIQACTLKEDKKAKRMRKKQLIQEEERERGNVSLQVYWSYMTAAYKGALIPLIISSQALFQALQIGSNWWMAWASPQTDGEASRTSSLVLILVYMGLAFGSTIFVFTRALLVATFGLKASQKLFSNMLRYISRAPMSFFDSTPAGRILSRVSIDQSVVDLDIPFRLGGFASTTIQLLGIILVMSKVTWQVLVIFIPMAMACLWMQHGASSLFLYCWMP